MNGIEGSVESVNISAIVHVVQKLGHAQLMMLGDKLHTKNNENTRFLVKSHQAKFYSYVLKVYINFQCKKKKLKKITKLTGTIPLISLYLKFVQDYVTLC